MAGLLKGMKVVGALVSMADDDYFEWTNKGICIVPASNCKQKVLSL